MLTWLISGFLIIRVSSAGTQCILYKSVSSFVEIKTASSIFTAYHTVMSCICPSLIKWWSFKLASSYPTCSLVKINIAVSYSHTDRKKKSLLLRLLRKKRKYWLWKWLVTIRLSENWSIIKYLKLHLPCFLLCMPLASQHTVFAGFFSHLCCSTDTLERWGQRDF